MDAADDLLLRIAAAVADGLEIDWEQAERDARTGEERDVLRQLRVLGGVGRAHWGAFAGVPAEAAESAKPLPSHPSVIGDYRIVRKLGEGGMGVVFEAEQQHPKRPVALKVIRGAQFVDDHHVRLFQREAQTLARLKHPGIAAIYESGRTEDGRHFFAMELIRGETLSAYLGRTGGDGPLTPEQVNVRLAIFRKICDAVSYAHQRGVVHRDLKPGNVMVLRDSVSSATVAAPRRSIPPTPDIKVLDFGLARITDPDAQMSTILTDAGSVQGTLPYMSPEQVRGNPDEIDLRTDVYSLGVILYEMLTGRYPYDLTKAALPEAVRIITEAQPAPLSRMFRGSGRLEADLATIVAMALEKEPARRYQSALALSEDLQRYLTDQPILARPPSALYLMRKLVSRHKVPFAFATALVVTLAGFAVTMAVQARHIASERDRANREAETSDRVSEFLVGIFEVSEPGTARGNSVTAREILDKGAERVDRELKGQPLTQARLMGTMGRVYRSLGLYDRSQALLEGALAIQRGRLGEDSPDLADSFNNLGWLYQNRGNPAAARPLHERALQIQESAPGVPDLRRAWSLYYLGSANVQLGKLSDARVLLGRSRDLFAKSLGPESPSMDQRGAAWCWNDLGKLEEAAGDHVAALPLFERALEIKRKILPPDDPDLAMALNNVGNELIHTGDLDRGGPYLEQALAIQEKTLGPDHPITALTIHSLGEMWRRKGEPERARPLLERAIAIQERTIGADKWDISYSLVSLGALLRDQGEYTRAEALFRRALSIREATAGPEHAEVAEALKEYATLMRRTGRDAEAGQMDARAARILSRKSPKPS